VDNPAVVVVVHWVDESLARWLAVVLNVEVGAFHGADQIGVVVAPARRLDSQSLLQTQRCAVRMAVLLMVIHHFQAGDIGRWICRIIMMCGAVIGIERFG